MGGRGERGANRLFEEELGVVRELELEEGALKINRVVHPHLHPATRRMGLKQLLQASR